MLSKSSHGLAKEGICRIRLAWPNCSQPPDFLQIAPILLASSSGFQCVKISQNIQEKSRSATVNLQLRPKLFLDEAKKCKEPRVCFVKRPSATPFTNWSTSTQNSLFAEGSRQGRGGRCLPGNRCSGPCGYLGRSFTFRPRVQCCVAWYNALPAHLLSTIEWVQMRALRIIYLRKLYNLLESLELRTGAVGSVWAL